MPYLNAFCFVEFINHTQYQAKNETEKKEEIKSSLEEIQMDYNELLDRARKQLPDKVFEESRFKIPKVQSSIEGNKTIIINFKQIISVLDREENHFLKFMAGELATSAVEEGTRAVFAGKHSRYNLQQLLERYIEEYLICTECGKPDTKFEVFNRVLMKRCEACGATTAVKPLRK